MSERNPISAGIRGTGAEADAAEARLGAFRDAFARWATGVAVAAVRDAPHVYAITATAFLPVSLEPPLVLVSVGPNATVLPFLVPGAPFAVSLLGADQKRLASLFTDSGPLTRAALAADGDPVVPDALAAFRCAVAAVHEAGDHRLVLGAVRDVDVRPGGAPLVYWSRGYRTLA